MPPASVPSAFRRGRASPASVASTPERGAARSRAPTASITCSATVRANRASHARGIAPVFSMVPVAVASESQALLPEALLKVSVKVSSSSSWSSAVTATETVFAVSPGAKVSVPVAAV